MAQKTLEIKKNDISLLKESQKSRKSELVRKRMEMEIVTNQKITMEGKFTKENVVIINGVMTTTQEPFNKVVQQIIFLNPMI